jgi:hypothetical protein
MDNGYCKWNPSITFYTSSNIIYVFMLFVSLDLNINCFEAIWLGFKNTIKIIRKWTREKEKKKCYLKIQSNKLLIISLFIFIFDYCSSKLIIHLTHFPFLLVLFVLVIYNF